MVDVGRDLGRGAPENLALRQGLGLWDEDRGKVLAQGILGGLSLARIVGYKYVYKMITK
jgi:hypothetical protein